MALRPWRTARRIERPYTRISYSVKKRNYISVSPPSRITQFEMGIKGEYSKKLYLVSKNNVQIRSNALEAARIVSNKFLEKKIPGKYFLKFLKYPHHIVREHSIATGAGADRFSEGMRLAFGYPTHRTVQIFKGEKLIMIEVNDENFEIAKQALKRAAKKLPMKSMIIVE
ncbi:MAG: 50S ribosomal protein L16 [Candidatus Aenigmatarchaeota archaeon]